MKTPTGDKHTFMILEINKSVGPRIMKDLTQTFTNHSLTLHLKCTGINKIAEQS